MSNAISKYPLKDDFSVVVSDELYDFFMNTILNQSDIEKILDNIDSLIDAIVRGTGTHYSAPFVEDTFEYRLSISAGRELRIYYQANNPIYFLVGFIKKTQKAPKEITSQVLRVAQKYREK